MKCQSVPFVKNKKTYQFIVCDFSPWAFYALNDLAVLFLLIGGDNDDDDDDEFRFNDASSHDGHLRQIGISI